MKTTDFARCLTPYLNTYLPGQSGLSENTILACCYTFKLVFLFAESVHGLIPEKITLAIFNADFVAEFLLWLEQERGNTIATRNQRLSALRAFARYARSQFPGYLLESQKISDMKAKKHPSTALGHISADAVRDILIQPDPSDRYGQRDMLLLSLMYDSGARVQEICDLRVRDIRLQKPYTVTLIGKGRKTRVVPIMANIANLFPDYLSENRLDRPEKADTPLFFNHQRGQLTRAGVAYILKKHYKAARKANPQLPLKISPHILRHSKAMHMLQAGVNLVYIRDFLGHTHVETTEVYARADTEMRRAAIESAQIQIEYDLPAWADDKNLMSMLVNLCGRD